MNDTQPARSAPRSRRALLTAAAAAGGALATQALVRPTPVAAADVLLGGINTATAATTIRSTEATSTAKALVGHVLTSVAGPSTAGVQGQSNAQHGNGVFGYAPTGNSKGVWGRSSSGIGVYGEVTATTGANYGVRGISPSSAGIGVQGLATATSGTTYGVFGQVASPAGRGVQGVSTAADGTGVYGQANNGYYAVGVSARANSGYGIKAFGAVAIDAQSPSLIGVAGTGFYAVVGYGHPFGVIGHGEGDGIGVRGIGNSANSIGVTGEGGAAAPGVMGTGGSYGVHGKGQYGVRGESTTPTGIGVLASGLMGIQADGAADGIGVLGTGQTGVQANGVTQGVVASGSNFGVSGTGLIGVQGYGNDIGVYGQGGTYAGDFAGDVRISGIIDSAATAMMIDHPADPANKTLAHSCVEAAEVLNIYRGTVTLDGRGRATVRMPAYFRTINTDFGYQLTAVGSAAPELHVAREIERNSFAIGGGTPGQKVCWVVTAARSDPWAKAHPFRVERRKRRKDQGRYLHPELYGQSRSAAMNLPPKLEKPRKPRKAPKPASVPKLPKVMRANKLPSPSAAKRASAAVS